MGMMQDEYLGIFLEEFEKNNSQAQMILSQIREGKRDHEILDALCRCFHTIKGSSAMLGYESVSELAKRMENVCKRFLDKSLEIDGHHIDLLSDSIDQLKNEYDLLIKTGKDGLPKTKKVIDRYTD